MHGLETSGREGWCSIRQCEMMMVVAEITIMNQNWHQRPGS